MLGKWLYQKITKFLTTNNPPTRSYLCDFDRICHDVRPADVLLIEGRNRISRLIRRVTLNNWSHSALYIGKLHDIEDPLLRERIHKHYHGPATDQLLLESILGQGTIISPITKY